MHLRIYASTHVCMCACVHGCMYAGMHVSHWYLPSSDPLPLPAAWWVLRGRSRSFLGGNTRDSWRGLSSRVLSGSLVPSDRALWQSLSTSRPFSRASRNMSGTLHTQKEEEEKLRIKLWSSSTKFLLFVWMTINSKNKELETVGDLCQVWSQILLKCLDLARFGRPDIFMEGELLGKVSDDMEQGMRWTIDQVDNQFSPYWRSQTLLVMLEIKAKRMQIRLISGYRFRWRPGRLLSLRQDKYCAYSESQQMFPHRGHARHKQLFRMAAPTPKFVHEMPVCDWKGPSTEFMGDSHLRVFYPRARLPCGRTEGGACFFGREFEPENLSMSWCGSQHACVRCL